MHFSIFILHFALNRKELAFIRAARVAHLATADRKGQPHVIPICFVFDGKQFFSPIDEKPKRAAPLKLKRIQNIQQNPQVALVIDRYDDDWRKLAYVLIFAKAKILLTGKKHQQVVKLLRRKYSQYRRMEIDKRPILAITPERIASWSAE